MIDVEAHRAHEPSEVDLNTSLRGAESASERSALLELVNRPRDFDRVVSARNTKRRERPLDSGCSVCVLHSEDQLVRILIVVGEDCSVEGHDSW
jgi:hypothetical protein